MICSDFEDVGEVAADCHLQVEAHELCAVIGDIEVLVHAAVDHATDHESDSAGRHRSILGFEGPVNEEDARGVVADSTAVQNVPGTLHWNRLPRR